MGDRRPIASVTHAFWAPSCVTLEWRGRANEKKLNRQGIQGCPFPWWIKSLLGQFFLIWLQTREEVELSEGTLRGLSGGTDDETLGCITNLWKWSGGPGPNFGSAPARWLPFARIFIWAYIRTAILDFLQYDWWTSHGLTHSVVSSRHGCCVFCICLGNKT